MKISVGGDTVVQDEFVETQYYREMNSIDKEHHTVLILDLLFSDSGVLSEL